VSRLALGKIPIDVLQRTVLRMKGAPTDRILMGPEPGVDFGVVRVNGQVMIVSSDPITGVASNIGWYAVNVSANDVATSGNPPQFLESVIMLPGNSTEDDITALAGQMHRAARAAGISVIGGHTELTPGLDRPIVVATVFAFAKDYVSSAGARDGDAILMTKTAGLEGTAVLARESERLGVKLGPRTLSRAKRLEGRLSVVPEAVRAYGTGAVHGMHDCTEGGVLGAVYEMSLASNLGFELGEGAVPLDEATIEVSKAFSVDPIRLIGSGSVLIAVAEGGAGRVRRALEGVCSVAQIGKFRKGSRVLIETRGRSVMVAEAPTDELWGALTRRRRRAG
jgi:hydrogenase maturation factor